MKAAMWGKVEVAQVLLNYGADLRDRDLFGMTPFLRAVYAGQLDMVKFLISKGAKVLDVDHVRDVRALSNFDERLMQHVCFAERTERNTTG